ncbi:protein phosphatase 2C domain-containing protein [Actinomarinicola tropica]|nr:protein phosphatase 2C domain-containing protein [Actinomarinicola tropica]
MVIDVRWGSATHQGRVRQHNEDAVLAGPDVFAVADGMGGHAGGEVASGIAVAGLADLPDLTTSDDPASLVVAALGQVNAEIRRRAAGDDGVAGMGTTIAGIARVAGPRLLVFNLGDTRVYRFRAGRLDQLTEDHSVVGELTRRGEITADEARHHPHRHVVTRALGVESDIRPMVATIDVAVGDCFLVASDGLFNELHDDQMGDLLATPGTVESRARALLDAALLRGARDNVSVIVVVAAGTSQVDSLDADTSPRVATPADPAAAGSTLGLTAAAGDRSLTPTPPTG